MKMATTSSIKGGLGSKDLCVHAIKEEKFINGVYHLFDSCSSVRCLCLCIPISEGIQ